VKYDDYPEKWMSFRRGGAGKRRDALEPELVAALEAAGVQVWRLNGAGLPDLLCFFRGRFTPLECKSARGTLTVFQAGIPWPIVRSLDEAFSVLGIVVREDSEPWKTARVEHI
jgi:Holliday junction resolvase